MYHIPMAYSGQPITPTGAPEDGMSDLMIELSRMVHGIYARTSDHHDLTPVQAKLLCVLVAGPKGMAELADSFGVGRAALTGLVDRAEQRGLVQRSPVPHDRRAVHVTLTSAGRLAARRFHADAATGIDGLTYVLGSDDRQEFREMLVKIVAGEEPR